MVLPGRRFLMIHIVNSVVKKRGILLMRLYIINSMLPSQSMADSPQAHRIIVSALACRSDVLLRERLGDSAFLSYAV